ncbi:hypothetical protein L596_025135 [Steinernema carpocapsae]|uniref:Uncharacterized protein n=1 Tax=Steinernema carpocapsae TaxID=34508 RepID=A0A4U5M6X6_STECR|nr:hypothetical protein L596_025135 [Steinernema carpocapsae]
MRFVVLFILNITKFQCFLKRRFFDCHTKRFVSAPTAYKKQNIRFVSSRCTAHQEILAFDSKTHVIPNTTWTSNKRSTRSTADLITSSQTSSWSLTLPMHYHANPI